MSTNNPNPLYISKAELKRMKAREFNRQYDVDKANPKDPKEIIREALVETVNGFSKGLGL